MRAACSKNCGRRPCADELGSAGASARLFLCERCRALVLICSCCDRGQIYCANGCAEEVRRQSVRAAGELPSDQKGAAGPRGTAVCLPRPEK
jgi:hypothetical protein